MFPKVRQLLKANKLVSPEIPEALDTICILKSEWEAIVGMPKEILKDFWLGVRQMVMVEYMVGLKHPAMLGLGDAEFRAQVSQLTILRSSYICAYGQWQSFPR